MDEETDRILRLIATARSAWDQYNIQLSLPLADTPWIIQGHPWDSFNDGHRAPQVRRDPAAIGAAWNHLQTTLVELSDAAERVRGRAGLPPLPFPAPTPADRRVGSLDRAELVGLVPSPIPRADVSGLSGSETALEAAQPRVAEPTLVF